MLYRHLARLGLVLLVFTPALAADEGRVLVGTYGGGVAAREPDGRFSAFDETRGLKVSAGAMLTARSAVWLGSEGRGLFRLGHEAAAFEPVAAALPSPNVTALLELEDALLVGTDEGVALVPFGGRD